jgi:hypothetical protein
LPFGGPAERYVLWTHEPTLLLWVIFAAGCEQDAFFLVHEVWSPEDACWRQQTEVFEGFDYRDYAVSMRDCSNPVDTV